MTSESEVWTGWLTVEKLEQALEPALKAGLHSLETEVCHVDKDCYKTPKEMWSFAAAESSAQVLERLMDSEGRPTWDLPTPAEIQNHEVLGCGMNPKESLGL